MYMIENIITLLWTIILLLVGIAFYTLLERKSLAAIQRRKGPNTVGIFGLLQPIADGLKAEFKEPIIPTLADKLLFTKAPIYVLTMSWMAWLVLPMGLSSVLVDLDLGLLYIFVVSTLGVYGVIFAGWASNSRYAFLGGFRAAAQMISYEISLSLCILPVVILANSLNLTDIVLSQRYGWNIVPLFPAAIMFFVSSLAETNRTPFDLPEAEAELVAGYNVEYSGIMFALFMLAEYGNMILMSTLNAILFLGGWLGMFANLGYENNVEYIVKILFFVFLFVLVRGILPRYRYDQLMGIGWKIFLPVTFGYVIFVAKMHSLLA